MEVFPLLYIILIIPNDDVTMGAKIDLCEGRTKMYVDFLSKEGRGFRSLCTTFLLYFILITGMKRVL